MVDFAIGSFVRRYANENRPAGLWHLVDSDVADTAVTRCGKRMWHSNRSGTLRTFDGERPGWVESCSVCVPSSR